MYSPAMTDFIFMVRETSHMAITGPDVVKAATGEDVTLEELGGAMTHATKSGVATFVTADEKACLDEVRYLLSFLPANNLEMPPHFATGDDPARKTPELVELMPASTWGWLPTIPTGWPSTRAKPHTMFMAQWGKYSKNSPSSMTAVTTRRMS